MEMHPQLRRYYDWKKASLDHFFETIPRSIDKSISAILNRVAEKQADYARQIMELSAQVNEKQATLAGQIELFEGAPDQNFLTIQLNSKYYSEIAGLKHQRDMLEGERDRYVAKCSGEIEALAMRKTPEAIQRSIDQESVTFERKIEMLSRMLNDPLSLEYLRSRVAGATDSDSLNLSPDHRRIFVVKNVIDNLENYFDRRAPLRANLSSDALYRILHVVRTNLGVKKDTRLDDFYNDLTTEVDKLVVNLAEGKTADALEKSENTLSLFGRRVKETACALVEDKYGKTTNPWSGLSDEERASRLGIVDAIQRAIEERKATVFGAHLSRLYSDLGLDGDAILYLDDGAAVGFHQFLRENLDDSQYALLQDMCLEDGDFSYLDSDFELLTSEVGYRTIDSDLDQDYLDSLPDETQEMKAALFKPTLDSFVEADDPVGAVVRYMLKDLRASNSSEDDLHLGDVLAETYTQALLSVPGVEALVSGDSRLIEFGFSFDEVVDYVFGSDFSPDVMNALKAGMRGQLKSYEAYKLAQEEDEIFSADEERMSRQGGVAVYPVCLELDSDGRLLD